MRTCFVCENDVHVRKYCTVDAFDYVHCSQCGLIFVDRLAVTEKLYRSYDGGAAKALRRKLLAHFRGFEMVRNYDRSMARARQIFAFIAARVSCRHRQPMLLDIGCNKGFLLAAAIEDEWNVYGIEIVPELVVPFRRKFKKYASQVFSGRFTDAQQQLPEAGFDAVAAIDVIEHFETPEADVEIIYRKLKPGGVFVIQTPDGGCDQAHREHERWGALKPLEHLHLFNRDNLTIFARRVGFQTIAFSEPFEPADGNLVAVMTK